MLTNISPFFHIHEKTKIDDGSNVFVFDEKLGHDADSYFNKHPEEWNDELKNRCWYVSKSEVTLIKKSNCSIY